MAPVSKQTEEIVLSALDPEGEKSVNEVFYELLRLPRPQRLMPATIRKAAWQLRDKELIRYYKKLRGSDKYLKLTDEGRKRVREIGRSLER